MNWTLATADGNDPSFLLTNLDIIAAIELQVSGSAAVDIGNGALVATVTGVELNLATMTVSDGVTTLTGADVLSFTGTASLFAGEGGSLNAAHDAINNGTIGFAVNAVTLSLVMARGALDDAVVANRGDSYVGVSVAIDDAELIGVSGLELYADGTLKLNAATDGVTGLDLPARMNWTLATADGNDPSFLLTNLDIIAAIELQVSGSAAVDIGNGALVATVTGVELNLATMTVSDGVTTLTGADVLSFTGTASLFAGEGGSLNAAHDAINNGTIGFAVNAVTLSLVMARGALDDAVVANRGDSYVGVSVAIDDAELIGVSGLELYADGTLKLNAATDGVTGLDLPARMNWTLATADGNDPSFLLTNLDIIAAIELQVSGSAAVDIGNGALVATVTGVELNLATMTVSDGVTTLTGADVLSFTGTASLFAGEGGSLNAAHDAINNGTIGFAVNAVTLSLVMARGALDDAVVANRGDSYVGVSVAIDDAELIGVSGLELYADGTLKLNAATDGVTGLDLPARMNWTLATADGNDPSFLLTNLDIIAAIELQVSGSAAVDIGNGALVATVTGVELNLATMTVSDGVTTLTGADVLSFTGTASLFAGEGGSLNAAHDAINNGTIGFAVNAVTLSLVMARGALDDAVVANRGDSYVGVSVAIDDAELIGVSGLELYADGTLKLNAATDGVTGLDLPARMNWTLATADGNDPSFLLTNLDIIAAIELQVSGSAAVDIGNGALVATVTGVELNLATMTVSDGVTTLTGADVLSFTGTASLFAGEGGSLNAAHDAINNGTIGFAVNAVTLSLVMARGALDDAVVANRGDSYVGVSVAIDDAELIGVSGLELYADGTLKLNAATDGVTGLDLPARMNWTLATADGNDPSFLLTNLDIIAAIELQVSGSAAVDIGNGALVATVTGVELNLATMTVSDGVTTLTGADVLSFTGTASLFAGEGGSLNAAHDAINNGTIGFAVNAVTLSLVMARGALDDAVVANRGDSYVGVSVAIDDAELIGVSGLELYADGTLKLNAATDGVTGLDLPARMNWTLATADGNDPSFLLTNLDIIAAIELQVSGSAAVDIGNGALVATVTGVELNLATMTVSDGVTTLTGADVLSFTGTASLFAGEGGSLNAAHDAINNGTIGFAVNAVTLSLVMARGALDDAVVANRGDSYVGVSVAIDDAELIGVSGLELYADGTLKLNAATDGVTGLDLPARMNWTLATADGNDPSFLLTNLDIIAAIELQVSGSAAVDIGNGALVATVTGVELNLATMTVSDGVTTLTGADVLSFTGTASLFAGEGGSLNAAHDAINNGTIGFAVNAVTLSLVMARGALDDAVVANRGDSYVGVSVAIDDAELIGVSGLELYADGTLKLNAATDGVTGLDLPARMNWTLATADGNDPSFLLTNLDIIAAIELQVSGSAAVDIGNGALVATVTGVELNLATMTVSDGVTTLTGADVLSFTGTASLFAGEGGSLNAAHDAINNGTIGFAVNAVTLSLVMARGALDDAVVANRGDSYVGVSVAIDDAELIGVSGLELYADGTLKLNAATDGVTGLDLPARMNWTLATADGNDPSFLLTNLDIIAAIELQVSGSAAVDIGNGALVATVTGVELNLATMTVSDGVTTLTGADVLSFTGTASLFAGEGGSLNAAHDAINNGTIGFAVNAVTLSLVMARGALDDAVVANRGDSYVGVSVAIDDAELIGVSGLELYADGTLKLNAATDGVTGLDLPARMNWTLATADGNDPSFLLTNLDIIAAIELQVSGSAAVDIGNGALVATVTGVELNLATMTVSDGVTTLTGADVLSFTGTASLFAGEGGSLNAAHDAINNGTIGFAVNAVTLSLVMARGALDDAVVANRGDSYVGVSVAIDDAELIGVSGLELYADGTLKLNAATDGVTGLDLPARMNWTLATADGNDPSFLLTNLDIIAAIELQVSGSAAVDIGNGALVATVTGVELNLATMTVSDGVTTLTGADVLSFTGTASLFAGEGGSLNAAHDAINNGTIGFAVNAVTLSLVMARGALDDAVVANRGDSYVGVSVAIDDAELIGVSGLELYADGTLKLNAATDGVTGLDLPARMNWTLATADGNDPSFLLTNLDIIAAIELQVSGSAAVDIGNGALVATVTGVELNLATMTVSDGVTTLTGADVLSFTGTASLFAGEGGSLNAAHDAINNGTIGFAVNAVTLSLVMARGALDDAVVANRGDSYVGVSVAIDDAELIGVSGLELYADGTLKLNAATDGVTGLDLPARMNWTLATADGNDPSFLLTNLDIIAAIELQVSGSAAVNAFGFFVVTVSVFEMTMATVDINSGNVALGTLAGASLMSISLSGLDAFAGVGGSLSSASASASVVTNGALGFEINGGSVAVSIVKPGGLTAGDLTSYTGFEIGLAGAQLLGVDGLTFIASGSVLINKATDAAGLDSSQRIDWFEATSLANDPGNLIPAFSANLTDAVALQIDGSAALDVFGSVVGTASFSIVQGTQTIGTGNPLLGGGTLVNASVMVISLSNLNLFAGVGGGLAIPADPTDVSAYGIDTAGALGFSIVGGSVDLAIVRPTGLGPTDKTSYLGLEVTLVGASLIGIEGLQFNASGTVSVNKAIAADGTPAAQKINWAAASGSLLPGFSSGLTSGVDLRIAGQASLDIFGFVVGTAEFTMAQGTSTVSTGNSNIGTAGTLNNASIMSITLTNLNLFAGVGAVLNDNGTLSPIDDTIDLGGAIGFSIADGSVAMGLVRPATINPADKTSFMGMAITVGSASLVGIEGLVLKISGTVLANNATDSAGIAVTERINWATASDIDGLLPDFSSFSSLTKDVAAAIEGSAVLDLFGIIVGSADFDFSSRTVDVDQNANGVFSLAEKDLQDATLLTIGLSNLNLFVGVGASLDPSGLPITAGAIGFSVTDGSLGLAIIRANATAIAGDNRSYMATTASLGKASFVGLPSDISIVAADISVDINRASGTIPLLATAQVPSALDWTAALDLDDDGQFGEALVDDVVAGGQTIALVDEFTGISGKLGLSAFGVVQAFASFEMTIRTVDVDVNGDGVINSADLNDAQLMALELAFLELDRSADINGDGFSNAADAALYDALKPASVVGNPVLPGFFVGVPGGPGFKVDSGRLTFATIKANPDATKSVDVARTYTVILANVRGAELVGLPEGIEIEAIRLDFASSGSSLSTATVPVGLNWTTAIDLQASAASFGADPVVVGTQTIALSNLDAGLSISGALKLDILGSVLAAGEFEYDQLSGLNGSDGAIALVNAAGQRLSLSNLHFFVGVNGGFIEDADGNVAGLDTDDAIGFSVTGASLDLIIVKEAAGTRSWMGLAANVAGMGVHGLPDAFELEILNLALRYNGKAADASKLDWAALAALPGDAFGIDGTSLAAITRATDLSITGQLYLNISSFVIVLAGFSIDQQSGMAIDDTKGVTIPIGVPGANVLAIRLSGAYLFVGVDGAINKAGYQNLANPGTFEEGLEAVGAVGFFVNNANLDLAIVSEPLAAGGKKWVGVAASIDSLGVTGLPDAFTLKIKDLEFFYNVAASNGSRMDWKALAANSTDGFNLGLGALALMDNSVEFRVAGSVMVAIENFVYVSGSVALQRKELFVKTVGSATTTKMSILTLGASGLRAFVGIGDADSDNDDLVDDDATLAQNAIGVVVGIDDLAIVLAKPVVAFGAPPSTVSYFALSGGGSASLIGVDGVEIGGRVQISINKGSDKANPAALTPSIDFLASATSNPDAWGSAAGLKAPTGPAADQFVIVNFAESNLLRVAGYITISIADFLHLSGQFSFSQSGTPQTVKIEGSTSTKQVNVMTIGASDVNAFVGVGGPYFVDSNDDGIIDEDDTPLDDGAMGFVLRNLDFALALFKPVDTAADKSSYYAIKASGGAEVIGIDGITIRADVLGIEINGGKNNLGAPQALDLATSRSFEANGGLDVQIGLDPDGAGDLPAPSLKLDFTEDVIRAFGAVTIIIDNFVYVSGNFEFVKSDAPKTVVLTDGTSKTVSVLTVGASDVNAFIGTGDPDSNADGLFDLNDDPEANGAIGLAITDLDFGLALFKPVAIADRSSYYALRASANGIDLVGVPGVILGAGGLQVAVNGASVPNTGGPTPTAPPPVINFSAAGSSFGSDGFTFGIGGTNSVTLDMSSRIIAASGNVTIGLDFDTDDTADITLSSFISFEQSFRPNGSSVIKIAMTNLSFALGDPADPVFELSGLSGFFLITQQGMAASIELNDYSLLVDGDGANLEISGDIAVQINTTNTAVNETFVIDSLGNTKVLSVPKGPSLRLTGFIDLRVTFDDAAVSDPFVLRGNFSFEQVSLTDPDAGGPLPASKAIRIAASDVTVSVLGVGLFDGQGGFIFGPDGIAGQMRVTVDLSTGDPGLPTLGGDVLLADQHDGQGGESDHFCRQHQYRHQVYGR
jgi:ClpP class serine protease